MTNITAKIRRLEKDNDASKVKSFLCQCVLLNVDLRPWEKRVNALMRQVGIDATIESMNQMKSTLWGTRS